MREKKAMVIWKARLAVLGWGGMVFGLVAACSDGTLTASPADAAKAADEGCEKAKSRAVECKSRSKNPGEVECQGVRCAWSTFRDAQSISNSMATRACDKEIGDFLKASVQTHINEPGVRDFITACSAKAAKPPAEGGCYDPGKHSYTGECDEYAAMNDSARKSYDGCLTKATCAEFEACYNAIFAGCGNWQ